MWILRVVKRQNMNVGYLIYQFMNDEKLNEINIKFLGHDDYTDIITFDYCEKDQINSDIFISLERVQDNSNELNVNFLDELERVCIHGILHLCGYPDKKEEEALIMRQKEDFYLTLRPKL